MWQCSQLRHLRIAAQLPLQAGQFRPARLAALQTLHISGCCHIPTYFAEALGTMQQVGRGGGVGLVLRGCQAYIGRWNQPAELRCWEAQPTAAGGVRRFVSIASLPVKLPC